MYFNEYRFHGVSMSNSARVSTAVRIISMIAIAAMTLISLTVYHASIPKLLIFAAFAVFYMQLPGLLIMKLLKISSGHISGDLLISFFTGWALVIVQYFLCDLIPGRLILYVLGPVLSILYIYMVYRGRLSLTAIGQLKFSRISAGYLAATAILMAYVFLNTQFEYLSPELCTGVSASIDKVYQMGLSMSLSHDYPLQSPWVSGVIEYYHLYSQILLSVPNSLFGLTPDFLVMSCSPYMTVYTVSLGFYSLFRYFCANSSRAGIYTLSVILSNMFIARTATSSYLFRILFVNDNHGGFAISCLAVCAIMTDICIRKYDEGKIPEIRSVALLTVLVMLLTGIKAPVALVFAGAVIGTFMLGLILRAQDLRKAVPLTITSILGFAATYMFLIGADPTSGATSDSMINFGRMTGICFWKDGLIAALTSIGVPRPARLLCILLVFGAFYFTIYALPFVVGYLRELVLVIGRKKDYDFARITIYATALVGFVLMMFMSYEGHSQIYFGTAASAFAPLIAIWFLEARPEISSGAVKHLHTASCVWFFAVLILTTVTIGLDLRDMVPSAEIHADPASVYSPYTSLSADEYEAVNWIKENTPEDSLFATQMYISVSPEEYDYSIRWNNCHFLYASYSDRHFYLEGSGFSLEDYETPLRLKMIQNTNKLYDPANAERGDLARSLDIDYVMVTKKIYPTTPDLSSDDYESVFSNPDIEIYKVSASD